MSTKPKPTALLEALLFASSQPLSLKRLTEIFDITEVEIKAVLEDLEQTLEGRGLELIDGIDGYELEVAADLRSPVAAALSAQSPPLSAAALEVLTIIAHKQPVTKSVVDEVRGVASDVSLRMLLARDLVVARGKQEGAPLYHTTNLFLKSLGLKSIKDLPEVVIDDVKAAGGSHASQ